MCNYVNNYFCSSGENSTCIIIFIVVYYFLMAGVTWFVILTYTMNLSYGSTVTNTRDALEAKRGHFHMLAWSLPLVLTIVCLAISQVCHSKVKFSKHLLTATCPSMSSRAANASDFIVNLPILQLGLRLYDCNVKSCAFYAH